MLAGYVALTQHYVLVNHVMLSPCMGVQFYSLRIYILQVLDANTVH